MASPNLSLPYTTAVVSGSATTSIPNAKYIVGYVNLAVTAQTPTLAVTDNNGLNANVPQVGALGVNGIVNYPPPGMQVNGLSVTPSGALTAPGVAILYRTKSD